MLERKENIVQSKVDAYSDRIVRLNKMNIALKEADETEFWLRKLLAGGYIEEKGYQSMHDDNEEIVRILVKIIKTMKQKCNRNG